MKFRITEEQWKANRAIHVALLRDILELSVSQQAMFQLLCELLPNVTQDSAKILQHYNDEKNRLRLKELCGLEDSYPELAADIANEPPLEPSQLG
jgi:hypothetical protein